MPSLPPRAGDAGASAAAAVGIRYWNAQRNCGDAVSAYLIRDLLGYAPVVVGSEVEHVLTVGSILSMARPASHVWGAGLAHPDAAIAGLRPDKVAALRGARTAAALRRRWIGGVSDRVVLGDPGVLVRRLPECLAWQEDVRRQGGPRYRAAIVPHWTGSGHPFFTRFPGVGDDVVLVDMRDDTLAPLRSLIDAEVVLSQSLHGLIFAEALGKPTLWISHRDDAGWCFKFEDWYTNVVRPPRAPVALSALGRDAFGRAEPRTVRVDEGALMAAFPAEAARLGPEGAAVLVPFEQARRASPHQAVVRGGLLKHTPRRLDQMAAAEVRRASDDLAAALGQMYQGWAERPFTLLARPGWRVPNGLAVALRDYLEQATAEMVAVLSPARRGRFPADGARQRWRGWDVAPGLRVLGDALMLRPNGTGRLDGVGGGGSVGSMDMVFVPC